MEDGNDACPQRSSSVTEGNSHEVSERDSFLNKKSTNNGDTQIKFRQFIVMVSSLICQSVIVGVNNALGVIYVDLIRELKALRSEAALVQSVFFGTMLLGGVFFTGLIQKYGPGAGNIAGSLVLCISFLVGSFSVNIFMVIVFAGLLGGIGASISFLANFASIHMAFQTKKRTAMAILTLSSTLGQFCFPYIAEALLEYYYWKGSFLVLSGIMLQILPFGLLVHCSESTFEKIRKASTTSTENQTKYYDVLTNPVVVLITVIMLTLDIGIFTQQFFVVDLAEIRGFERIVGATFLSLMGLSSFAGRIIGLILLFALVNTGASVHYTYGLVLYGVAHFIVGYFTEYWPMLSGIVLQGLSSGLLVSNFPAVMMEQCGAEIFLKVLAIGNVVSGITDITGGFIGGLIADQTGGYELMYYIAAGFIESGALLMLAMLLHGRMTRHTKRPECEEFVV